MSFEVTNNAWGDKEINIHFYCNNCDFRKEQGHSLKDIKYLSKENIKK